MTTIHTILTHPGGAHKDEFLACSVLLAIHPVPIVRREPAAEDLADAATLVIDVGHEHAPERGNFDHHQLPKDHPPTCSLSLVLQHLGIYEDARAFCDWLEPAEWFDCRGPKDTAKWLGVSRDALDKLISPIDVTLLRRFAQAKRLEPGEPLWEIMRLIGSDLLDYIKSLRERLDFLAAHTEVWELDAAGGPLRVLFLPRTEPLPEEASSGMDRYAESLNTEIAGLIYPDRRGTGYGLSRYNDDARLDFTRISAEPDVHFAHARGFVAKTSAADIDRLKTLMLSAWV